MCLGLDVIEFVESCPETAYAVWNKLHDVYQKDTIVTMRHLKAKLYSTKMEEGSDFSAHAAKLDEIIRRLDGMCATKLDNNDKIAAL